jgi:hypothetical protein
VLIALGMVAMVKIKSRVFSDPGMGEADMMLKG